MEDQPQSNKKCILEISELDFIRINEWLKQTIGTKHMSKLSKEMLTMRIDKHLKSESGQSNPLLGLLGDFMEGFQGLLTSISERDKKIEALVGQLKARGDDLEKMKAQMGGVLMQFKAEREKHAAKVAEMEKLLKEREDCIADGEKLRTSLESSRKNKLDETFAKLFEKNAEISNLKEQLEASQQELSTTKQKLANVESHLRSVLDLNGGVSFKSTAEMTLSHVERKELSDLSGISSALNQTDRSGNEEESNLMYRFFEIIKVNKTRGFILGCLGIEDIFRFKSTCMYLHRIVSTDFHLVKALDLSLRTKYETKTIILERSLSNRP